MVRWVVRLGLQIHNLLYTWWHCCLISKCALPSLTPSRCKGLCCLQHRSLCAWQNACIIDQGYWSLRSHDTYYTAEDMILACHTNIKVTGCTRRQYAYTLLVTIRCMAMQMVLRGHKSCCMTAHTATRTACTAACTACRISPVPASYQQLQVNLVEEVQQQLHGPAQYYRSCACLPRK